jgi:hypothetical protein
MARLRLSSLARLVRLLEMEIKIPETKKEKAMMTREKRCLPLFLHRLLAVSASRYLIFSKMGKLPFRLICLYEGKKLSPQTDE